MIVEIDITAEDIKKGQGKDGRICACPLYLAAKRVIPNLDRVTLTHLILDDGVKVELPRVAREFIKNADVQNNILQGRPGFSPDDQANQPVYPLCFPVQILQGNYDGRWANGPE